MSPALSKKKTSTAPAESEILVGAIVEAALDKKATDIVSLDLRGLSSCTDFYVICTIESEPQMRAVARSIEQELREKLGAKQYSAEGDSTSNWVVLDYIDVMVHIFTPEMRLRYAMEELWGDAPVRRHDL